MLETEYEAFFGARLHTKVFARAVVVHVSNVSLPCADAFESAPFVAKGIADDVVGGVQFCRSSLQFQKVVRQNAAALVQEVCAHVIRRCVPAPARAWAAPAPAAAPGGGWVAEIPVGPSVSAVRYVANCGEDHRAPGKWGNGDCEKWVFCPIFLNRIAPQPSTTHIPCAMPISPSRPPHSPPFSPITPQPPPPLSPPFPPITPPFPPISPPFPPISPHFPPFPAFFQTPKSCFGELGSAMAVSADTCRAQGCSVCPSLTQAPPPPPRQRPSNGSVAVVVVVERRTSAGGCLHDAGRPANACASVFAMAMPCTMQATSAAGPLPQVKQSVPLEPAPSSSKECDNRMKSQPRPIQVQKPLTKQALADLTSVGKLDVRPRKQRYGPAAHGRPSVRLTF